MHGTADLIAETYALGAGPWTMTPVTRGALGQIWKLSGAGTSWAVKELLFGCDEEQVRREAALRRAAERLGIASPRLMPDRRGAYVSRLGSGSPVKLYDWIDGTRADASDPDVLDWFGRTMALLHQAGAGGTEPPSGWYERCPRDAEWKELHTKVERAGLPWADALGRFVATSAVELARWVTPSGPDGLVTSHLDLQPQNVLVGPDGPVLLDWDNAGSACAERELARALFVWSGGNEGDVEAGARVARAYREAGGSAVVRGPGSFSMLFATELNYVRVQAECAIDPTVTAAQREFASGQVVAALGRVPDLAAVSRLCAALDG
ncbi:phosphotransferase enzyme family protein [Streptomyces sp. MBT62]|uniref:phosphotransferase enzyme family protein n=1 Tax=Streptomyces sp. MBT62 TaxID=2800410 RepID=UPI00190D327E|nr:phosphotransferase [Streptomyces sp. MBT62]MBK3567190.1 phosphotransferase [Streptomyces sp. MBT62]